MVVLLFLFSKLVINICSPFHTCTLVYMVDCQTVHLTSLNNDDHSQSMRSMAPRTIWMANISTLLVHDFC